MTRYEDLRRGRDADALPVGGSWGLTLFLRRGLAGWMHAWPEQRGNDPPVSRPACTITPPVALPVAMSGPLVTILANMIFTARGEVLV